MCPGPDAEESATIVSWGFGRTPLKGPLMPHGTFSVLAIARIYFSSLSTTSAIGRDTRQTLLQPPCPDARRSPRGTSAEPE